MFEVTISRAQWGRGRAHGSALKRANDGKMCCLGFIAKLAGFTDEEITACPYPSKLFAYEYTPSSDAEGGVSELARVPGPAHGKPVPEIFEALLQNHGPTNTWLAAQLAVVNDDPNISDTEREQRLTHFAAEGGYKFIFVD
jgi:hypothetical protein